MIDTVCLFSRLFIEIYTFCKGIVGDMETMENVRASAVIDQLTYNILFGSQIFTLGVKHIYTPISGRCSISRECWHLEFRNAAHVVSLTRRPSVSE